MKYILVTGGVISGVGKGIIASSFGTILKSCGLTVTSIKIDPYINIDAGTFSPYEHGEVYVLDDGSEVDLDLGNYERFLDATLHKDNNLTTGKIYQHVIQKEREGKYLGKTVQVVPHITDAIQSWVSRVANNPVTSDGKLPDVCIIELGGTIGDIEGMPFVEAFRQFQFKVQKNNFCLVHVSLVPQPRSTGEHKTKPTQSSVRELRSLGLTPDIIVCRSETPISEEVKEKISNFCHVQPKHVICIHDLSSIYKVPILVESQGIVELFNKILQLDTIKSSLLSDMSRWKTLANRSENLTQEVRICVVGKYTKLEDAYASLTRALQHACLEVGYKLKLSYVEADNLEKDLLKGKDRNNRMVYHNAWRELCNSEGVIVPGGFGQRGVEGKIAACRECRENNIPFLGICLGFQVAVIEFARNVLGSKNADSSEFKDGEILKANSSDFIIDMPEHNNCDMGGTMRLGKRKTFFDKEKKDTSILYALYKKDVIEERHRHRYEVNKNYVKVLEESGLHFVATDETKQRMEILELIDHPYFVATQFHPEYLSRPLKCSPPFLGLILAAKKQLSTYIQNGRLTNEELAALSALSVDKT
ncbi:hypothetical protein V9T40_009128 [Parthenolecanium corni]|uniref:CTP synthase n=1 Tax=Parthenolecanium corni TaxID=536013 RepID=A0AAN9TMZ6_9HEMI